MTAGMMAIDRVISRRSHGFRRRFRNPSMTICPASVPVSVEFCPEAKQRAGKQRAGEAGSEHRREKFVGIGNFRDVVQAARVKRGGAEHQNRGVDEQRKRQRQRGIEGGVAQRFAFAARVGRRRLASARCSNADTDCAASPWRPGCRWRCTAFRDCAEFPGAG